MRLGTWNLDEAKKAEEIKFSQKRLEKQNALKNSNRAEHKDLKKHSVLTEQNIRDLAEINISNPFLYDDDEFEGEGEGSKTQIISQEALEEKELEQARKRIGKA
ncbi:MAG TPA: hypothetical protein P5230_02750 [Candidatus Magasanikbacteria bacterium]|nr:hypothetical protein [Candidatus Magasanikbacteria bacterium]